MDNKDDKDRTLEELSLPHQKSIVSQLVDIGSKHNQRKHTKYLSFVRCLTCLKPKGSRIYRTTIDAFCEQQYVAVSYTWKPSHYEDCECGRYWVEGWDDDQVKPSKVRNCVFDRVVAYMHYANVQFFWIDQHCIRQDTCDLPCTHDIQCAQKRDAIQAMDLVYQCSKHPLALLSRPLQTESDLHLLARILSGHLVHGNSEDQLSVATPVHKARRALWLLLEITQEPWWSRAWTFQENYRGGQRMRLLIPHNPSLEQQKLKHPVFGKIPGELCVSSHIFSTEATRLCMALRNVAEKLPPVETCWVDNMLRAAGRYKVMLPKSSAMTQAVIADIEARDLLLPWDRLAIVANCCQYSVRLDSEALNQQRESLSLSVLAMCLLNGEILDNNDDDLQPVALLTASDFLKERLFKAFAAPEDEDRRLTFYKGCRLTNVELTPDGILAKGHLWKLGRVIDTSMFRRKLPWIDNPRGRLSLNQRKRLLQLVFCLHNLNYPVLAGRIDKYLATDANAGDNYDSFSDMYLHRMASELAAAIRARRKLRLGSIWDPTGQPARYRAVFVWSSENKSADNANPAAFVFTSAWPRDRGSDSQDTNDIDRHVSFDVKLEGPRGTDRPPHLRICNWVFGMCFFEKCPRTEVVFPWPRALQAVRP
ncbi:hypothetical protein B0I35DRAFT_394947 [Stachybotrys elegans]|uniref:Heterokaryon incompatibility domain-containing protein n=1 Tax=Stachybotrys elegans TaxID=80388 RepID=A0A8K0SQC7_9HYPO|nr:hypothetical protein B0I35DRAFT_394947 [Stachybotrys elegans]